jgi:crossover junction endodeoxyribonuclease RuvC
MKKNWQPLTPEDPRVVLGIDPGTLVTGFGIVSQDPRGLLLLDCGTIDNRPDTPLPERLLHIHRVLVDLLEKHRPDEVAIESAFYGKNAQSALKLGHARGVALLAAVESGLPTAEYSPREVKRSLAGKGNASKEQVQFMVKQLLRAPAERMVLDASDALAIAICHLHQHPKAARAPRSWRSYVQAHPERVRP